MRLTVQPPDEAHRYFRAARRALVDALEDLARAHAGREGRQEALDRLHEVLWQTQALTDLAGRARVQRYARSRARAAFAIPREDDVASVPFDFDAAIRDLLSREPRVARAREEVMQVYQEHGFTLAKAADLETVRKVQLTAARLIEEGTTSSAGARIVEALGDWTRSYADTVFQNAQTTAYTAGQFRELQDPDVAAVIGALELVTVGDSDTRPNHQAARGLIAAPGDPVWFKCAPPNGHRCRCGLRFVGYAELRARNLLTAKGTVRRAQVPPRFHRDPGFVGTRPDFSVYG